MTNRGYTHIDDTDTFVSNATIPDYPIDTDEKRAAVVDFIDTICPDSDDAYVWDSEVMRRRHDRYVQLMYLAKDGLEHAAEEIKKLRAELASRRNHAPATACPICHGPLDRLDAGFGKMHGFCSTVCIVENDRRRLMPSAPSLVPHVSGER